MAKFRKKPVVVEAIQLKENGSNLQECYHFVGAKGNFPECGMGIDPSDGQFKITTLEGVMTASLNDFIIKGVQGEFYPCKPNIFEATYDIVEEVAIDHEKTFGELAVGISFNPSELSDVDKVKRDFANVIDLCNNTSTGTYLGNTLKGMAIRACIQAQMCVVKLITFKE